MTDENINPQETPVPKTDFLNRILEVLKTRKNAVLVIIILALIVIPLSLLTFSKKTKQPSPIPAPTASLTPTRELPFSPSPTKFQLPPEGSYVPDQLIVKYKSGQSPEELKAPNKLEKIESADIQAGFLSKERLYKDTDDSVLRTYYLIKLKQGSDLLKAVNIYKNLEEVGNVDVNHIVQSFR